MTTTAAGHYVVLYDGLCRFCTAGARRLRAWTRSERVEFADFQKPGVRARFPGLTHDECMKAMQVIAPDGRVFAGFEGGVRVLTTIRFVGWLAYAYYLPGLRWLCDRVYALIAARRYRIMGKEIAQGACEEGTCAVHFKARS